MIWILLALSAAATPATDAVQVRTFPGAVAFTEQFVEDMDQELIYDDLSGPASCYDLVGIADFNLEIPIDEVSLTLGEETLDVEVRFGPIGGTDMLAYGTDSDVFDGCVSFETDLRYVDLQDAVITAQIRIVPPSAFDLFNNSLMLEWVEPPVVTGDLDMDLAWVPDGVVLYFFEDTIFEQVSSALSEAALPVLEDLMGDALYAGEYEGLVMGFKLSEAQFHPEEVALFVDSDVLVVDPVTCEIGEVGGADSPGGRGELLPLDRAEGADLAIGLTEAFLNNAMHGSWEAGHFCFQPDAFQSLVDDLALLVDPEVGKLEGWATMNEPSVLTVSEGGMDVVMDGLQFTMTGTRKGKEVVVLDLAMDVSGDAIPGFDQALTALTLSMRNMRIDFTHFDTDFLVSDSELVAGLVQNAVERWAARWAEDAFRDTVLLSSLYYAYDVALFMERVETREGGLELYFSLYSVNDPAVDQIPPDTSASLVETTKRSAVLAVEGTDDRPDALAFAVQVDGEGWSDFFSETEVTLEDLAAGEHTVEVVSRDRWLNVDESPAVVRVEISGKDGGLGAVCGGCDVGRLPVSGGWLGLVALAVARRRSSDFARQRD